MDLHHLIDAGENDSLKCPKCALALAGSPEPGRLKPGISCDKCHQGFHYGKSLHKKLISCLFAPRLCVCVWSRMYKRTGRYVGLGIRGR